MIVHSVAAAVAALLGSGTCGAEEDGTLHLAPGGSLANYSTDGASPDAPCGCQDGCQGCDRCGECNGGGWLDLRNCPIKHTSCCYDDFISPITNPTFFEDPRNLTEARLIFLNHKVPGALGGGDVQLYALQVRAALTDRLSFIATKDGFIVSSNPLIDDGWADVAAGLKYLLFDDPCAGRLLSAGTVYKMAVGSQDSVQGTGDGTFHQFLTGGTRIGCHAHWISDVGWVVPTDGRAESELFYWSNHFDYMLGHSWYFLSEFNWYNYLDSGDRLPVAWEGGDLYNVGADDVTGNDVVTGAFGLKYKPNRCSEIGVAWELPLTDRRDVLENRITVDWILRY